MDFKSVWKYSIPVRDGDEKITMPKGAKPIHVAFQQHLNVVELWAEVEPGAENEVRHFRVFSTGNAVPNDYTYLGTAELVGFPLVWHLYEGVVN